MSERGATLKWRKRGIEARKRLLTGIRRFENTHGFAPTVREMATFMDYQSTAAIQHHLEVLRQEGRITYTPSMARTVRIVEFPDASTDISRACD